MISGALLRVAGLILFGTALSGSGIAARNLLSTAGAVSGASGPPVIGKIDPPNWWARLPDPMLLLHGERLQGARFDIHGSGIRVEKTRISSNGHWAFLWLSTQDANPQQLLIHASTPAGSATATFSLQSRKPAKARYQGFSSADVMYLIMTDRFADGNPSNDRQSYEPAGYDRSDPHGWHGGDLRGIDQHLDYLQHLGVTTLWTTPVYDNGATPEAYHGYSAVDMYRVDPHFGTLSEYQHLADDLHSRGMKLVLDTVPNHVGPRHPWVTDPPTPDWFHGTLAHHTTAKPNFQALVDPHSSPEALAEVTDGWFVDLLPDLNQENALVSRYLIQNAVWWIESVGLDGLRLDTFPFVRRTFWHDFDSQLQALYPHLTMVGEVFDPDPTVTSYFAGGERHQGIDTDLYTPFDYPLYFALRAALLRNAPMTQLTSVLGEDRLYLHSERLVIFEGNHDVTRFMHEKGATLAGLKLEFGLLATLRGMPQIYSGDEIAMDGAGDPDNRRDFPGGFPGDLENAFTARGRTTEQQEMYDWVRQIMAFRRLHPVLQRGLQQELFVDDSGFAFVRSFDISTGCRTDSRDERLLIAINNSDHDRTLSLETSKTALTGCSQFTEVFGIGNPHIEGGDLAIPLSPKQLAIFEVR